MILTFNTCGSHLFFSACFKASKIKQPESCLIIFIPVIKINLSSHTEGLSTPLVHYSTLHSPP